MLLCTAMLQILYVYDKYEYYQREKGNQDICQGSHAWETVVFKVSCTWIFGVMTSALTGKVKDQFIYILIGVPCICCEGNDCSQDKEEEIAQHSKELSLWGTKHDDSIMEIWPAKFLRMRDIIHVSVDFNFSWSSAVNAIEIYHSINRHSSCQSTH